MQRLIHHLRPSSYCPICSQKHKHVLPLCIRCEKLLPHLGPACKHCATPLPDITTPLCGPCAVSTPALDNVYTAFRYEEPLRTLLQSFKYQENLYLTSFLSHLIQLSLHGDAKQTQCLIPVPMHPKRLKERGFNQAVLLTKQLAKETKLNYTLTACKKIVHTAQQAQLNRKSRQLNLENAFIINNVPFHHVTIVDDLITTGCTANTIAHNLKKAGVTRVDLWCCAKTTV